MTYQQLNWENVYMHKGKEISNNEDAIWLRDGDIVNRLTFLNNHFLSPEFTQNAFELRNILLYVARGRDLGMDKK